MQFSAGKPQIFWDKHKEFPGISSAIYNKSGNEIVQSQNVVVLLQSISF